LLDSTLTIPLTTVLPEITALIPAGERQLAEQVLHVPRLQVNGELADTLTATPTAFDFIVADGVVLKQTRYAGRDSLELLGAGDVLAPPLTPSRQLESRATSSYQAHGQASLAVIESRFRTAARRWPQLSDVLHDRLARQTHRASMHLAILHIARAEDRVLALFSDLAERFGQVTSDGIVIDVELTHDLIGQLIGSRRPTVSAALEQLSTTGALIRTSDDRWMLNAPDILG
jgi:CRP/FNR family cyclic AMP-dependent transcriptional regulator